MCGIYLIRNTVTNKVYVGQSVDIERRWAEHKARAFNLNNNCSHKPLYLSMRKHGLDAFTIETLCECTPEELNEKEIYYINLYDCVIPKGYNILPGGNQAIRAQLGLNIKQHHKNNGKTCYCLQCGQPMTARTIHGLCNECYRKSTRKVERPTKEQLIQELKEVNGNFEEVGRHYQVSGNTIRKWCKQYNIGYHTSDYKKPKQSKQPYKIAVNQIDKNTGEIIATYDSSMDAARALGKSKGSHITEVCKGIHTTAYGYKWEYAPLV